MAQKHAEPFQVSASSADLKYNPLAWLLWALDFLLWAASLVGPLQWLLSLLGKPAAVQVGDAWRLAESKDAFLTTPFAEVRTIHDLIQRSCAKHADQPAFGTRSYLGEHRAEGARFPLKKFGETSWMPYRELGRRVNAFGAGLVKLGLKPIQGDSVPDMILLFEETCAAWATAALGAFTQSLAVATSYATLGIGALVEAIAETGAKAIVCNIRDVAKVAAACSGKCPSLQTIIFTTNVSTETCPPVSEATAAFQVLSFESVVELGAASVHTPTPPTAEHLAVIMYTSAQLSALSVIPQHARGKWAEVNRFHAGAAEPDEGKMRPAVSRRAAQMAREGPHCFRATTGSLDQRPLRPSPCVRTAFARGTVC